MVWCSVTTDNPAGEVQAGDGTLTTGLAWNTSIALRNKAASSAELAVKAAIMIMVTVAGSNLSERACNIAARSDLGRWFHSASGSELGALGKASHSRQRSFVVTTGYREAEDRFLTQWATMRLMGA
jgi:hypothetical protein